MALPQRGEEGEGLIKNTLNATVEGLLTMTGGLDWPGTKELFYSAI
jgi:hypothetical protein